MWWRSLTPTAGRCRGGSSAGWRTWSGWAWTCWGGHVELDPGERPSLPALIDFARRLDQEAAVTEAGYAVTANLFARRDVFDDIGLFTEGLRAGVDVEWVLRARDAGYRLGYSRSATVHHPARATAAAVARKAYSEGYGTGQWRYRARGPLSRHGPAWRAPSSWQPVRGLGDAARIVAAGHRLPRRRRAALDAAHYVLLQLPTIAGSAVATLRRGRL
jgi:hypothetical protein